MSIVHFSVGAVLGLSVDEAHYLLYAAHPALSYFDHPPMVGWVQIPLVALNAPEAVLRLVPQALWLASAVLVYRITVRLSGDAARAAQAAVWATLAFAAAPLLHVLGIGLLPDTLLVFWSLAIAAQTLRLMETSVAQRAGPWLLMGLLLGLAGLSKYTAILPAAAMGVCMLLAHGWAVLRNKYLWVAAVLALALVSPVLVWNAQNQWVSFHYQAQHGAGGAWSGVHVLRFLGLQVLAFGPLLWWGAWGVHAVARGQRCLLAFFVIPFAVFAWMSGGGSSLPHWTAPAWAVLAPFAGIALARSVQSRGRWVVGALLALQLAACAALLGLMASAGQPWAGSQQRYSAAPTNPFADLHGWSEAGQKASTLAAQRGLTSVAVQNWTLASRLGWYVRPLPVYALDDRFDQFDLWAGDLPAGGNTLLVDWSQMAYTVPLAPHGFASCTWLDTLPIERLSASLSRFDFYDCRAWSGKPAPQLKIDAGATYPG
ncbi:ArnT family glycosyltransferase [Rhodoferax aquaticus]|uniref:ArnT family glycosyltransferase n=1 Tax=Rhodoferax aquaticus TaxID=2527691 RepID=UPI00143D7BC8|nr:glycosyltransferase family 39 protein [Rhodoferax aquaticus]